MPLRKQVGQFSAFVVLASSISSAAAANEALTLVGPRCKPLITGLDMVTIGEVCTDVIDDEVDVAIALNDDAARGCCLKETHICNIPTMRFEVDGICEEEKFYDIVSVTELYNFMCVEMDDTFQIDGHASIISDRAMRGDLGGDGDGFVTKDSNTEIVYSALYAIDFICGGSSNEAPTKEPTALPTRSPTAPPTESPTAPPTESPTAPPTQTPTAPPTQSPTAPPSPDPTQTPTEKECTIEAAETLGCADDEYVSQDCECVSNACDACPDGTICIGLEGEQSCLDCSCGFCNRYDMSCCENSPPNQCNKATTDNAKECTLQKGYFPAWAHLGGQACSGVHISDLAANEGCGCKPSNDAPCAIDVGLTQESKCFVCTANDILKGGDCSGDCRSCIFECFDERDKRRCENVGKAPDMQVCVIDTERKNSACLAACSDICVK